MTVKRGRGQQQQKKWGGKCPATERKRNRQRWVPRTIQRVSRSTDDAPNAAVVAAAVAGESGGHGISPARMLRACDCLSNADNPSLASRAATQCREVTWHALQSAMYLWWHGYMPADELIGRGTASPDKHTFAVYLFLKYYATEFTLNTRDKMHSYYTHD